MNMKKMLSLALAGVMALSLMACSAQNGGDSSENTSSQDAFSCPGRCDGPEPHGLLRSKWRRFFREYLLARQQPVQ